jgi:murein DD-endopeptidase MepM/ murein hydrolase activator NlpD
MNVRRRIGILVAVTVVGLFVCCGGSAAAFFLGGLGGADDSKSPAYAALACGAGTRLNPDGKLPSIDSLGDAQIHNAAVIISVGQQLNVPPRGWVIAIATALQESALTNLPDLGRSNDHDSIGLFQQRPSQGWGTVSEIMDPVYSSKKFYAKMLLVANWQRLSLTVVAQRVQRSAYPNAYAKHEPLATAVVNALADDAGRSVGELTTMRCTQPGEIAASGWTVPVAGAHITSAFRTAQRPTHNGDDLAAPKGTPIHAAAAGVVTVVRCQATKNGVFYGCDRDGSLSVQGCGWYVEILHAGNIITRYCHQIRKPEVVVGQQVAAGQEIGWVGDTGNSSGPHCHFEVHVNGDNSAAGAIDPVPFMNNQGAPLGGSG